MSNNEELEKKVNELEANDQKGKPKSKKTIIRYILNISLVLIATGLAIFLSINGKTDEIIHYLNSCDWRFLLAVLGVMFLAMLIRSFVLYCFARMYTKKYYMHQALAVDQIGIFYSAVTPGSTGGQPMQAYTFKKQGIPLSSAISMLAMYSIIYQIVLIIYGIISFIVKYDVINEIGYITFNIGFGDFNLSIWPLTIIGFLLNVGVIGIVLAMGYWKGFHHFIMGPILALLHKIHLIKNLDKSRESLRVSVENFKIEMRRLASNIPFALLIAVCFFLFFTIQFSIPYFIGLALHNESTLGSGWSGFWNSIFLSNYHQMVTGIIPIPGSALVSELFFSKLFVGSNPTAVTSFYYIASSDPAASSQALGAAALLLWRSITFIIPLFIAGLTTAFYRASPKTEAVNDQGKFPSHQTLVAMQSETYVARKDDLDTMIETSRLTRQAILNRLNQNKTKAKKNRKKQDKFIDVTIEDKDDSI